MLEETGIKGLDGSLLNRPQPSAAKAAIDIEALLSWAIAQSGHLPWHGVSERELMYDHGYTVVPRHCSREYRGGGAVLARATDDDAATVIAAIKGLDGAIAAVVIACARSGIRPDWMAGVEPRLVPRSAYAKTRGKKRHRRAVQMVWVPCHPDAIRAAREIYQRWHLALQRLMSELAGELGAWEINAFSAPAEPWAVDAQQAA